MSDALYVSGAINTNPSFSVSTNAPIIITRAQKTHFHAAVAGTVIELMKRNNPDIKAQDVTESIESSQGTVLSVAFGPVPRFGDTEIDGIRQRLANMCPTINYGDAVFGGKELRVSIDMMKGLTIAMEKEALERMRPKRGYLLVWIGIAFLLCLFLARRTTLEEKFATVKYYFPDQIEYLYRRISEKLNSSLAAGGGGTNF